MSTGFHTILLVDDDEPTNILHKIIIDESGLAQQVVVATSGIEALKELDQIAQRQEGKVVDLILLDLNMPGMTGYEFMENYQHLPNEKQAQAVVVMLTTSLNRENSDRLYQMGISGMKRKPLSEEILQEILDEFY